MGLPGLGRRRARSLAVVRREREAVRVEVGADAVGDLPSRPHPDALDLLEAVDEVRVVRLDVPAADGADGEGLAHDA